MFAKNRLCSSILVAAAYISPVMITGCAAHVGVGYRAYDPYYRDYHPWGPDEVVFYNRWTDENHRDHREYRKLKKNEQKQYWDWRHKQHDDHDRH